MKAWLFLMVAHVSVCILAGYWFHHRETVHVDHSPVVDVTAGAEVAEGEEPYFMPTTKQTVTYEQTITFPWPLILYASAGVLALLIGGAIDLIAHLRSPL